MKKFIVLAVTILTLGCIGCNKEKTITEFTTTTESSETISAIEMETKPEQVIMQTERKAKDGALHFCYFFDNELVSVSYKKYMRTLWEFPNIQYVCVDNNCNHIEDTCKYIKLNYGDKNILDFCVEYNDEIIDFGFEIENTPAGEMQWSTCIYNIEEGTGEKITNKRFGGGLFSSTGSYVAIKIDDLVLFAGPKSINQKDNGEFECTASLYCISLLDYKFKEYCLFENETVPFTTYNVYEYDGYVYVTASCAYTYGEEEQIVKEKWYKIDLLEGKCELIAEFNEDVWFLGVIENNVFYSKNTNVIYTMTVGHTESEQEFHTVDMDEAIAFVYNKNIMIMEECQAFGENGKVKYVSYDVSKNITDTYEYDDWIVFLDIVGDKLIYIKPYCDNSLFWVNKGAVKDTDISETYIGSYMGWVMDKE